MKINIFSNELLADVQELSKAANTIKEETQSFISNLKSLESCMAELSTYWTGSAAETFQKNIFINYSELSTAGLVFKKIAADYDYAVNEYRKNEQKSIEIINAINNI